MTDLHHLPDALADGFRRDAVGLVESVLQPPAALRLVHGGPHRGRHRVGVEDHQTLGVAGGTADGLDQAGLAAEEALLVGVQNGHQRHLGQVQSFPQQVDAHQHVELAQPQVTDDLHPLQRRHVGVHIPDTDAVLPEMGRQILRHPLGEGGHQHPLVPLCPGADLGGQIVDLSHHRTQLHLGVKQSRGTDHLLHHSVGVGALILAGGGGDVDGLVEPLLKFLEFQGPVVKGAGQPEAIAHKAFLAGTVAVVHGPHLRQRHMALVHEQQEVIGKEVQQRHRRRPGRSLGDNAGIVLDTGAIAQLQHHLHVVFRPLAQTLRLHQHVVFLKVLQPLRQLLFDLGDGGIHLVLGGDVVAGGIDGHMVQGLDGRAGDGMKLGDAVDLIAEELYPDGTVLVIGGVQLHRVAPDPEHVPLKGHVVALVPILHQTAQQLVTVHGHAGAQGDHHPGKVLRLPQSVDTADGGHHDHVPPLQQGAGGAEPQAVDLLVGGGILLDIGVRVGDIGLRLVVVVVGHKVLHGVFREKFPELLAQLGGQCLIVGQHQCGTLHLLDDLGHGVGLAGAGNALEHLLPQAVFHAL